MLVALGTARGLETNSAQSVSIRDTRRKHQAGSAETRNERNNERNTVVTIFHLFLPILLGIFSHSLLLWPCDFDPKPGTHHSRGLTTAELFVPCVVCRPDGSRALLVLLFVLITFTTSPPLSGHYPIQTEISCRQAVITTRIREGQWTFEAKIVLLQVNASFMISQHVRCHNFSLMYKLVEFETHWIYVCTWVWKRVLAY